jgi:AcrR family transcriptional regulator
VDSVNIEEMTRTDPGPAGRTTYRHGDLRRVLLAAGIDMARAGGPGSVVLREATRRAGVAPNAAYRHFQDRAALLGAVCDAAQSALAAAIEAEQAALPPTDDPAAAARARFRAVGSGYLRFARAEPGLFRTAFSVPDNLDSRDSAARAGPSGLTPFQLLAAALDELVEAGVLPRERRPGAEFLAWSAVHGLATLLIDGPLRAVDDEQAEEIGRRLVQMVDQGL